MAGMGDRGIMISGGTLNLHGDRTNTWTKLSATANAGATSIQVLDAAGWKVGDEIVLASTDFDPRQAERRTIAAISGNTHHARQEARLHALRQDHLRRGRARRSGPADAQHQDPGIGGCGSSPTSAATSWRWRSSKMFVEGVELNRMGQHMTLARYPIHWHLVGDAQGPVHQERLDPRHLQPLRDGARHELPARREQRDLQHRRPLLLPGRRHRARQRVRQEPGHPDQVPSDIGLRARPISPPTERDSTYANRQAYREVSFQQGTPCCLRTTRWRPTGSPTRTIAS